jgi:hypothetical protein
MEGAHAAAIRDAAGFVDDVEAFGPRGVGVVGGVIDVVDAESDGVVEAFDEIIGDSYALGQSFRLGVADVVFYVGLHLPLVGRVGFTDIHGQEIGVIFVVVVNLHHVTDVAAERRSSVAAEDDDERASAGAFANVEIICTVEAEEAGVRSVVADFERTAVHVRQSIAEHAVSVFRTAGHFAEHKKRSQQNEQENGDRPFPEECHCESFRALSDKRTSNLA